MQNKMPISNFTPAIPKQRTGECTEIPSLGTEEEEVFYEKSIKKGKTSMKFMWKCRWVVNDSKKFEEMIKQLRDLNLSLDRLISPRFQSQQAIRMETDILQNKPARDLPVLERAAVTTRPALSNAVNILGRVSRLEPQGSAVDKALLATPLRNLEIKLEQLDLRPIPRSGCQTRAMANYQPKHGKKQGRIGGVRNFDSGLTQYTRDATVKCASNLAQIMASQMHRDPTNTFRKLDCAGYFVTDERVGYVFELPRNTNPSSNPRSLLSLLYEGGVAEDDREDIDKPPLEQRYALSKALCKCIYYLHASELVHKGIRSDNILFFRREGDRMDHVRLEELYITGFDHSRLDGLDDLTITKTTLSTNEGRYRHLGFYTSTSRRSTKIHDLYSLGLVLLEIAHWWKLKSLVRDQTGDDMISFIRDEYGLVSERDQLMGTRYRDAVERCIRSRFGVRLEEKGALQRMFLDEIMAELMKCNV